MTLLAIALIYASFIAVGVLASRRARGGTDEFMVAGRAMPLWLATMTMTATWVDGGYLLGTAEGAFHSSLASGLQGGVCFGLSLIIGGLFFARRMRALEFHTLIDPFERRFGKRWAVVLSMPAVLAETFWSAELLVALGSTFGVMLGLDLAAGIIVSAVVVTLYTMLGGMWAVAYTDAFQLLLVGGRAGGHAAICDRGSPAGSPMRRRAVYRRRRTRPALTQRVVVGRQHHADAWRRAVELLLPASAVVPVAASRTGAFDPVWVTDDRLDRSAAADGRRGVRVSVAARSCGATGGAAGRCAAADLQAPRSTIRGFARPGRDHRRGHVELLVLDPVCGIDVLRGTSTGACSSPICRPAASRSSCGCRLRRLALARCGWR